MFIIYNLLTGQVYGLTRGAHSRGHTVGGSSGGEAVLQTCAGVTVSLASDTGGSIRTPAAFTGLFGHKPSPGVVSTAGAGVGQDVWVQVGQGMQVLNNFSLL